MSSVYFVSRMSVRQKRGSTQVGESATENESKKKPDIADWLRVPPASLFRRRCTLLARLPGHLRLVLEGRQSRFSDRNLIFQVFCILFRHIKPRLSWLAIHVVPFSVTDSQSSGAGGGGAEVALKPNIVNKFSYISRRSRHYESNCFCCLLILQNTAPRAAISYDPR